MHEGLHRVVMAIGAHVRDIESRVGGTLSKYLHFDYRVVFVISTNNMSATDWGSEEGNIDSAGGFLPEQQMEGCKKACREKAAALGTTPIFLDHPQRRYVSGSAPQTETVRYGSALPGGVGEGIPTILTAYEHAPSVEAVVSLILEHNPEVILTHPVACQNIEHFATSLLVTLAFWRAVERGYEGGLLTWGEDVSHLGERNAGWDTFVDYRGFADQKTALSSVENRRNSASATPDAGVGFPSCFEGRPKEGRTAEFFTWVRRPARTDRKISGKIQPFFGPLAIELIRNAH